MEMTFVGGVVAGEIEANLIDAVLRPIAVRRTQFATGTSVRYPTERRD